MSNADVSTSVNTSLAKTLFLHNQGSLLQSKKRISGEIFKEPFLDILLTDLEQSSFSLILQNKETTRSLALQKQSFCTTCNKSQGFVKCLFAKTLFLQTSKDSKAFYLTKTKGFVTSFYRAILPERSTYLRYAKVYTPSHSEGKYSVLQKLRFCKTETPPGKLGAKLDKHISTNYNPLQKRKQIVCLVKIGDYVHSGDKIGYLYDTPIIISESGKILRINETQITIQKMQPVLFYSQAEIHVENNEWVRRGTPILTLAHQTLVTGDIVQGIPRIEQLFEASTTAPPGTALQDFGESSDDDSLKRSKIDEYLKSHHTKELGYAKTRFLQNSESGAKGHDSVGQTKQSFVTATEEKPILFYKTLQSQVRETFRKKWDQFPLPAAVRQSLEEIQQIIVESIQKVYISQGVLIADKHIEIIVRQMTCKAQIFDGGSTGLLVDEILSLQQIENANISTPGQKALYLPVIMGLTRAALSSDSFVSAASFQETTRVLSRDAVAGKTDFLKGLKEKVIIGDLIDAGTGLDAFYVYSLFSKKIFENKFRNILNRKVTHKTLKKLVTTIIDRS